MSNIIYVKIEPSQMSSGHDTFFHGIDSRDKTWQSVLSAIEMELESHFINNNESLIGISFNIEITDECPEDVDMKGDD